MNLAIDRKGTGRSVGEDKEYVAFSRFEMKNEYFRLLKCL